VLVFIDPFGLDPCEEDDDDPTCTPGTGNGNGYGYDPPPMMDAHIPLRPPRFGDDCDTNPTLPGCSAKPDLKPSQGCAFLDGGIYCWGFSFGGPNPAPPSRRPQIKIQWPPTSMAQCTQGIDDANYGLLQTADEVGLYGSLANGLSGILSEVEKMAAVEGQLHGIEAIYSTTSANLQSAISGMSPEFSGGPPGALASQLAESNTIAELANAGSKLSMAAMGGATFISVVARAGCYQLTHP
jgi:hypothetical protein